jgi:sulfite reductase (NADPH) flavoprotein alpha-component
MLSDQALQHNFLSQEQLTALQQATQQLSPLQLAWASGYLAAKSEMNQPLSSAVASAATPSTVTILYASQTGNAKGVAKQLAEKAKAAGLSVNLQNIADYKPKSLKTEQYLIIVSSTNGEGEPPDDALAFHEFLLSKKAPKLEQLHFSVLALGDSSYEFFCQTGKDFDQRLAELGAKRLVERVDCDVDYQSAAEQWTQQVVNLYQEKIKAEQPVASVVNFPQTAGATSVYNKENPFEAELLVNQKITGRDSNKDVRHIEISLEGSGLTYRPGDALGIWCENDPALASAIIEKLALKPDDEVKVGDQSLTLLEALTKQYEITQTNPNFIKYWAQLTQDKTLLNLIEDAAALREFANSHQLIDVLSIATAAVTAQDFVDALRKLTPRLYSIASSQAEVEDEVHLTVGVVQYQQQGEWRFGAASSYLTHRLAEGDKVKVFIEHNDNFKLPEDPATDIIMIGPGTGIAPFRAFIQQREADEATGKNWLFFGDQTFTQDFLYQVEWQNYLKSGVLTRLDVAFSRDQAEKVYVQHRLLEQAQAVFSWLENGAHLYICGDANRMAKDVHQALVQIISEQGQMSQQDAEDYLKQIRTQKRYQKDVY